ncbi:hypothetical protein PIB30_002455 [Stylosanthes scabra]|uniref:Aminotransferase-like plant mobile domain-containing protein n=1 Tax=Stylosanthes scabra TaxID=79078 RepID=A0ABU6W2J7_9FABA|nr:hypothetical protein [Stylosanthes scabra]
MVRGGQRQAARHGWQQPVGRGQRQPTMRSADINRLTGMTHMTEVPRLLELPRSSVIVAPLPTIMSYVRDAGFEGPWIMRDFDIDGPLLSSFVKRWRPKTHTFHLLFGEATITL